MSVMDVGALAISCSEITDQAKKKHLLGHEHQSFPSVLPEVDVIPAVECENNRKQRDYHHLKRTRPRIIKAR
jgi:hypothetical protein